MFNYKKNTIMKAKNFKNGVSVIIKSDDLNLNDVVVNLNKETKEVRVFRKMEDGTVKELKKVRSTKISHTKSKTTSVMDTEPITSESHNNKVVPADETKRQVNWRKFRANIIKEGGIDTYMKSRRENNIVEELLLKYPDFKRGMKLYESGSRGAWILISKRSLESVRRTYKKFFIDLDSLIAA